MATPTIKIDQSGLGAGVAGQSRSDLVVSVAVTLTDPANPGGASWAWVMLSKPDGSAAALSGASTSTASFTPDKEGTYLIELTVDGFLSFTVDALGQHVSTQGGCGVKIIGSLATDDHRVPSASETKQFDSAKGWSPTIENFMKHVAGQMLFFPRIKNLTDLLTATDRRLKTGGYNEPVFIPPGDWDVGGSGSSVYNASLYGLRYRGAGRQITRLHYTGTGGSGIMFHYDRISDVYLEALSIRLEANLAEVIRSERGAGLAGSRHIANPATRFVMDDVDIDANGFVVSNAMFRARLYDIGDDVKNDHHHFRRVQFRDFDNDGVSLEGTNCLNIVFDHCIFQGGLSGALNPNSICINTSRFIAHGSSSIEIRSPLFQRAGQWDIKLGDRHHALTVTQMHSEHSQGFLQALDYSYADGTQEEQMPIMVVGGSWQSSEMPARKRILDVRYNGPLNFHGVKWGNANQSFEMHVEPRWANRRSWSVKGCGFENTLKHGMFTGVWPDDFGSSNQQTGSTKATTLYMPKRDDNLTARPSPVTPADWVALGLPVPRSWFKAQGKTIRTQWATATPYVAGDVRFTNDGTTDRSYVCVIGGTSSGAGNGPVTTGSGIVDGSVTWDFLEFGRGNEYDLQPIEDAQNLLIQGAGCTQQVAVGTTIWAQSTAYVVGDMRYTNTAGVLRTYVCVANGTSSGSGTGPSGTGTGIADGSTSWDYYFDGQGYDGSWCSIAEGANNQFRLQSTGGTLFDPNKRSVAYWLRSIFSTPGAERTIMVLGTNGTSGGDGPNVRLTVAGKVKLQVGANSALSTASVNDGKEHDIVVVNDRARGRAMLYLDGKEKITVPYAAAVGNGNIGIGCDTGSAQSAPQKWREFAVWIGRSAEAIDMSSCKILRSIASAAATRIHRTKGGEGLVLRWNSTSQVIVEVGSCRADDDEHDIVLGAELTVDIASGGLDTGAEAGNTWYHVWLFGDSTGTLAPVARVSVSSSAPTLPAGYDLKRRLPGAVRNNGSSNFLKFYQRGAFDARRTFYDEARSVLVVLTDGSATAFTDVSLTGLLPPTSQLAIIQPALAVPVTTGNATDVLQLRPNGATASDGPWKVGPGTTGTAAANKQCYPPLEIPTDSGQVIEYLVSDADDDADLWVIGFEDKQ